MNRTAAVLTSALIAACSFQAAGAKGVTPARPSPAPLTSSFSSGVTAYSSDSKFSAATSGLVTNGFENVATGSNGQDYVSYPSATYTDANGTKFSTTNSGSINNLTIEGTQYGVNSNGSYGAIGADFGSAVLSTNYNSLTITFDKAVTAVGLDFGSLGTAFSATSTPDTYTFSIAGLGSATEGADGLINQGSFSQGGDGFFGVTSATPFTSITIDGAVNSSGFGVDNHFYDNVSYQAAPAVSAAPEPSTWLLMIAGVGGIGLMLRRAKQTMGFRFKDALSA